MRMSIRIRHRITLSARLLVVALAGGCTRETQDEEVYRIGIADGFEAFSNIPAGFKDRMAELGLKVPEGLLSKADKILC